MPEDETERREAERRARSTERLTYFSDAVAAIAMTLLAIELPVPGGGTVASFWASFRHDDGHYAAFLISFAVIAAAWSNHHDLFRYVTDTDGRARFYNICWLLTIVLNPFATKLLIVSGQSLGTHALRFGFYALLQTLESAALYVMMRHLTTRGLTDLPPAKEQRLTRQSGSLMLGYGLSIPVLFLTTYGWVLWFAVPLLATQLRRRRRPGPA